MITKINTTNNLNHHYINHTPISFKGYKTTCEDIEIYAKNIDSSVKTMSGNIDIDGSIVKGDIENMSGNIDISASNIDGDIENLSGRIEITGNSTAKGDISNSSGSITLNKSSIIGDVSNDNGKVLVRDANVSGSVTSRPENLIMEGMNNINELILTGAKKATVKDTEKIKADLAKQGIFIGHIGQINNNVHTVISTFNNNKLVTTKIITSDKPFEFTLPKGNIINTIKFDGDKQGVLILEDGVKFFGKIINGVIKRI